MFELTQSGRDYYYKNKEQFTHIVSIVCPDDDLTPLHNHHLVIKFWDIDHTMTNKFRHYNVVDRVTVLEPMWYINKWYCLAAQDNKPMKLLVHCDAGVSRSAAVSLGILWHLSGLMFRQDKDASCMYFRDWLDSVKEWCSARVTDDSVPLKRFIDGRINPGVQPNQAVLKIYRDEMRCFPW